MVDGKAAGHLFKDGICLNCGVLFMDVKDVGEEDVGKFGFSCSHTVLYRDGLEQLQSMKEAMERQVAVALGWATYPRSKTEGG